MKSVKLLTLSLLMSPAFAAATPFDLVLYQEFRGTTYWTVVQDQSHSIITTRKCPVDTPIQSATECEAPVPFLRTRDFYLHSVGRVIAYGIKNPGQDLTPLKADAIRNLVEHRLAINGNAQTPAVEKELDRYQQMLEKFPSSAAYAEKVKELNQQLAVLKKETNLIQSTLDEIKRLSESLIHIIGTPYDSKKPGEKLPEISASASSGRFELAVLGPVDYEALNSAIQNIASLQEASADRQSYHARDALQKEVNLIRLSPFLAAIPKLKANGNTQDKQQFLKELLEIHKNSEWPLVEQAMKQIDAIAEIPVAISSEEYPIEVRYNGNSAPYAFGGRRDAADILTRHVIGRYFDNNWKF